MSSLAESSGKVRDIYRVDDATLLMVTSDRISAFDVVMAEPIPDKGRVLTAFTAFWLEQLGDLAPNHLLGLEPPAGWQPPAGATDLAGRTMLVRRAEMLPVECVVRGYLAGSAWVEYVRAGTVNGEPLPAGLRRSERLPEPIFTPATKATSGHDENIPFAAMVDLVGRERAEAARALSLEVYRRGAAMAADRGFLVADTKLELGIIAGELAICDEVLTPDSSRFWPAGEWEPGTVPPAFDKQPLRDWLEGTGWDKTPPPPALPAEVVAATRARYVEAYERITGRRFADWPGVGGRGGPDRTDGPDPDGRDHIDSPDDTNSKEVGA
ncbi:phosphoribosylaminoimidazolesuccinocarboxamide synthase [Acidimicrobiaceae bacterium USS-CC1]|uniref:Phosphoribosylaminoimidazole-succinocarboxamide synthase n=1 Tax=Acidiferrimicrobium australe TaxID=2664430 RepID=A0ABW9R0W1_9ACTN|nr:phosphoribosylaminoimidazolesuccinocarboxamide synthase [Acidiferrimicrobium australe]